MLTERQENEAKKLYHRFFELNPEVKNPTDINRECKFEYALKIGWSNLRLMQTARKQGFEWTKLRYWEPNV